MSRRIVLACILVVMAAEPARAQIPFPRDLVPTRTALARLGLERQFMAVVPLQNDERVLGISMAAGMVFAQTDHGFLHTYDAETAQVLWTARLGPRSARSMPISANSFAVFATNVNKLVALDRATGRTIWTVGLGGMPTSPTAADEDRVMVGLNDGKIHAFGLKVPDAKKNMVISSRPIESWNWQTESFVRTRPMPAGKMVAFGSDDGKVYVAESEETALLYRIATGGPIGAGFGTMGVRLLLVPSADRNLYAIDFFTAKVLWSYPSGAPINQAPLVAGNDIYAINSAGQITSVDPADGSARWTTSTFGGRLVAISPRRIYLESQDEDLFVIDRATGRTIIDAGATYERAGLNLRPYEYGLTNRENDRIYFATSSGMMICLREIGATAPVLLRDPKAPPFGEIPRSGVSLTPPNPTPPEDAPPPGEGGENPAP